MCRGDPALLRDKEKIPSTGHAKGRLQQDVSHDGVGAVGEALADY